MIVIKYSIYNNVNLNELELYRKTHPERLVNAGKRTENDIGDGRLICCIFPDVYIHPTASVHPTAVVF